VFVQPFPVLPYAIHDILYNIFSFVLAAGILERKSGQRFIKGAKDLFKSIDITQFELLDDIWMYVVVLHKLK